MYLLSFLYTRKYYKLFLDIVMCSHRKIKEALLIQQGLMDRGLMEDAERMELIGKAKKSFVSSPKGIQMAVVVVKLFFPP